MMGFDYLKYIYRYGYCCVASEGAHLERLLTLNMLCSLTQADRKLYCNSSMKQEKRNDKGTQKNRQMVFIPA